MARYKKYSYEQGRLLAVHFDKQILPGTFEYTLNYLIDSAIDLSAFDGRFKNDETGAPAYDPRILLKIVLFAYSRGIISSRKIERCCRENIIFIALSADTRPHFTTIADFISSMGDEITSLFLEVLLICDEMNLIGKEMFSIDGCKMPSNASKEWSGTKKELKKKKLKMETAIRRILKKHKERDDTESDSDLISHEKQYIKTLRGNIKKIKEWLDNNDDKPGKTGRPVKSNITDNSSAKMKTSKGVIQGYDGVVTADSKHQVVVHAEAFGLAQEHDLLEPMVLDTKENFQKIGTEENVFEKTKLTADSGFQTENNMKMLSREKIDGYIADTLFRKRDPRFADAERYRARYKKERAQKEGRSGLFKTSDFTFDPDLRYCICPAGKRLYRNGGHTNLGGKEAVRFHGRKADCRECRIRSKCLRYPDRTECRTVAWLTGKSIGNQETFTQKMKQKIDSDRGRYLYNKRIGTVEPVFANIRHILGLDRFSLRGNKKVNVQWKLYCIVHNLLKIHRYGPSLA
ncbi:MAG: IS1182 family transposase [Desulfobacteraceae bacterium]|nr:MAG: IS1182 family transposase [Desulfobacteraceae bacterium]